jgi:23S rRNA pseudouridine1911/1915/1917 synthase
MEIKPTIIFENETVVAVDKPAGLVVHPDGRGKGETLVDWILATYPFIRNVGEPLKLANGSIVDRPGIVHRLDKDTSGVLLLAKTQDSYLFLKRQFLKHEIKKKYHAFVYGSLKEVRGTIDRPIGRSANDFRKKSAGRELGDDARPAVTRWYTLLSGEGVTFVEAQPITGRTHQIRVHFHAIGHPVVCDPLYATGRKSMYGMNRLALHARSVTFRVPGGEDQEVVAPYPDDFVEAMRLFREAGAKEAPLLRRT